MKRFVELDLRIRSQAAAAQFDERFSVPAGAVSSPGRRLSKPKERAEAIALRRTFPVVVTDWRQIDGQ